VLGNGVGLALGGIGTSSRSMVGIFTPRHKQAEFFGLWGLTVKLAAVAGAPAFGLIKSLWGNQVAFAVCSRLWIVALLLMSRVNERAGRQAAHEADLAFGAVPPDPADEAAAVLPVVPVPSAPEPTMMDGSEHRP